MSSHIIWRILLVDDDDRFCQEVKDLLEDQNVLGSGDRLNVTTLNKFHEALETIEKHRFDLLILDVRLDCGEGQTEERVGIETLKSIKERCFIPVIFYTAVPHLVRDLQSQVIRVVEKTQGLEYLLEVIQETLNTRLPSINRAIVRHLEKVQREYMWDFVSAHWEELAGRSDPTTLAYLLAKRLALSLSESGVYELIQDIGGSPEKAGEKVHPVKYYVMPPVVNKPLAGDLYVSVKYNPPWHNTQV